MMNMMVKQDFNVLALFFKLLIILKLHFIKFYGIFMYIDIFTIIACNFEIIKLYNIIYIYLKII